MKSRFLILIAVLASTVAAQSEPWRVDYDRACELAKAGNPEQAIEALGKAYAAGLRDVQKVLLDPALDSLHPEREFRVFIRSYSKAEPLKFARSDEPGERVIVRAQILNADGKPAGGAIAYAFHADDEGRYTFDEVMDEEHARLFGYVRADDDGLIELRTVRPGAYPERSDVEGPERFIPRHLHLEVTDWTGAIGKYQVVFDDDPRMTHPHWKEWAKEHGFPIAKTKRLANGAVVAEFRLRLKG